MRVLEKMEFMGERSFGIVTLFLKNGYFTSRM
jgi:hypothetical protein